MAARQTLGLTQVKRAVILAVEVVAVTEQIFLEGEEDDP